MDAAQNALRTVRFNIVLASINHKFD